MPPDQDSGETYVAVRTAALRYLARREHGHWELAFKLSEKGHAAHVVEAVLDDLQRENLISEERFVSAFLSARISRGQGPLKIESELRRLKVDASVVEQVFDAESPDWTAVAASARRKRFGEDLPDDLPDKARQARFLGQRGFTGSQIQDVLNDSLD